MKGIASAVYTGSIRHRRFTPRHREFRHRVCYFYCDLAEVHRLFRFPLLFSLSRFSFFSFQRRAYLGPAHVPLDQAVRDRVEAELRFRPTGPIRVLSQIGVLGFAFNPVSFYYCFDENAEQVVAVVAEITNTPWNERHAYVLRADDQPRMEFSFAKVFHVSPFFTLDYEYRWKLNVPGERLSVHMTNVNRQGIEAFDATLLLTRNEWSLRSVVGSLVRYPVMAIQTLALIYGHAAMIWARRIPFVPHPRNTEI